MNKGEGKFASHDYTRSLMEEISYDGRLKASMRLEKMWMDAGAALPKATKSTKSLAPANPTSHTIHLPSAQATQRPTPSSSTATPTEK